MSIIEKDIAENSSLCKKMEKMKPLTIIIGFKMVANELFIEISGDEVWIEELHGTSIAIDELIAYSLLLMMK
jgi:hypothetical protein